MTDNTRNAEVRNEIHQYWQQAAPGWKKWEHSLAAFLGPVTQRLLAEARPTATSRVLDVCSGTGDPALQFATAVAPEGSVLGVDLTDEMLATARIRAKTLGLSNVTFRHAAAEDLDESDGQFDIVTSRFGVIFFPDLPQGLRRLFDLLKPGGRLCVSTWAAPADNPAFALPSQAIRRITNTPPPPPDTPGPLRLNKKGALESALETAGFADIKVTPVSLYQFSPNAQAYWEMLSEMSSMFRMQYNVLDANDKAKVQEEIMRGIAAYESDGVIRVPALARVGSATKP